jgi:hypothetical protein
MANHRTNLFATKIKRKQGIQKLPADYVPNKNVGLQEPKLKTLHTSVTLHSLNPIENHKWKLR